MFRPLFCLVFAFSGATAIIRCHVKTEDKCYRVVVHLIKDVNFGRAERMCKRRGFEIAQIPDQDDYDAIVDILRSKFPQKDAKDDKKIVHAWIGMEVDAEKAVITKPNRDSFRKWNWYRPRMVPSWNNVFLNVRVAGIPYQGMDNTFPEDKTHGVVCVRDL